VSGADPSAQDNPGAGEVDRDQVTPASASAVEELTPEESAEPWSRLNPRMLLVHPLRELIRYLPLLLIALVAGAAGGEPIWVYALSGLGVLIGLLQYFTTKYRITESHVQVHRGILNRRLLSVPRDRIRSVDVDSTILHRIFGLSVVKVGTGASHGQDRVEFNAMATKDVPALRAELLRKAPHGEVDEADGPIEQPQNLSRWQPSWVRFAPFTLSGVASIVVVIFFLLQVQFFDNGLVTKLPVVSQSIHTVSRFPLLATVLWGALILIVLASVVALVRYALTYGKFSIGRVDASTLHISHGLLRTRQVTLDERRLRGISIGEPLSLRAVGGATAHAIMTGLGRERGGVALLAPPGPREEAIRISTEVLAGAELRAGAGSRPPSETGVGVSAGALPLHCELETHGTKAHRRRYTRAFEFAAILAAIALVLQLTSVTGPLIWWAFVIIVPGSAFLAFDRFRGLGHALVGGVGDEVPTWLVTRHGSLNRKRSVLATEGIIGWTVRRSLFQRRAGVATVIATTAAGKHKYEILDLPQDQVWPLIERVSLKRGVGARR
jgi:putative membrane protein